MSLKKLIFGFCVLSTMIMVGQNKLAFDELVGQGLVVNATKTLFVQSNPLPMDACTYTNHGAYIYVRFKTGETHDYGTTAFTSRVKVSIKGYTTFSGTSGEVYNASTELTLDESAPEKVYKVPFTSQWDEIVRFEFLVEEYDVSTLIASTVELEVSYEEMNKTNVSGATLTANSVVKNTVNNEDLDVTFSWNVNCQNVPTYELQVLKLLNEEDAYENDITSVKTKIDWDQSVVMVLDKGSQQKKMVIAQGTGYYVWRVRPIGDSFGGLADSRDWGNWNTESLAQGTVVDINGTNSYSDKALFFYTQFESDKNWIYSRVMADQEKTFESINYGNGLGMVTQSQTYNATEDKIIANQSIYNYSGTPSVQTLPVPVSAANGFTYKEQLAKADGTTEKYSAKHFDADNNFNNPSAMAGPIADYYSNSNSDATIPNAEGYPFGQSLFYNDGTGRVKEQGGAGSVFKIGAGAEHTQRVYYGAVADEELIRIFGDEAPNSDFVRKMIVIDANNEATVTYQGKDGVVLATCLAGHNSVNNYLDELSSNGPAFTVEKILTAEDAVDYGDYGITTSYPLVLTQETEVTLDYELEAGMINSLCGSYCATCDYNIQIIIHSETGDQVVNLSTTNFDCNTQDKTVSYNSVVNLTPGSYIIEKIVTANNVNTTLTPDLTYLQEHVENLESSLYTTYNAEIANYLTFLDNNDLVGFYNAFGVNIEATGAVENLYNQTVSINLSCGGSIVLPIEICNGYTCDAANPGFEEAFESRWTDPSYSGVNGEGYMNYMPNDQGFGFKPGEFDVLIGNMINDGYDCQELWNCWYGFIEGYEELRTLEQTTEGVNFNLAEEFLGCTGRMYVGVSTNRNDYILKAHKYFNYVLGSNTVCEGMICDPNNSSNCMPSYTPTTPTEWETLYNCNRFVNNSEVTAAYALSLGEANCKSQCEARYDSYVDYLKLAHHNDNTIVEGDAYGLMANPVSGTEYVYVSDPNNPLDWQNNPPATYESIAEISCAATSMVERCTDACELTPQGGSMGTQAEMDNITKYLTWKVDFKLPKRGTCQGIPLTAIPADVLPGGASSDMKVLWDHTIGGDNIDEVHVMKKTADNGLIIVGATLSSANGEVAHTNQGSYDYVVMKLSERGEVLWTKSIGSGAVDKAYDVVENADGEFVVVGYSSLSVAGGDKSVQGPGKNDYWIVKLSSSGNIMNNAVYGGVHSDIATSVVLREGGGYVVGGYSSSQALGNYGKYSTAEGVHYWIIEVDESLVRIGDYSFSRTTSSNDYLKKLIALPNNELALIGNSDANNGNGNDYWLIKLDENRSQVGNLIYGGTNEEVVTDAMLMQDNTNIALAGISGLKVSVLKMSKDSWTVIGSQTYFSSGQQKSANATIAQRTDERLVLGSTSKLGTTNYGNEDYYFYVLNSDWSILTERGVGGSGSDYLSDMVILNYNDKDHYILAGNSLSGISGVKTENAELSDIWLVGLIDHCTHDEICYQWEDVSTFVDPFVFNIINETCEEASINYLKGLIQSQLSSIVNGQLEALKSDYLMSCADKSNIQDQLKISYPLNYHHYMLYYHDRAGNLVKTIPPQGVDLSSTTRAQHPNHQMATTYQYDGLGRMVKTISPDAGTTTFYYDDLGRLKASQNAQQAIENRYSYMVYDEISRVKESGSFQVPLPITLTEADLNNQFWPNFQGMTKSERTYTVYDQKANVQFIGNKPQRYLQNRVSYVYNDNNVYSYYSYDVHGNVEWMIQELPELGKQFIAYDYDILTGNVNQVSYNKGRADQFFHKYTYDEQNRIKEVFTSKDGVIWDNDARYDFYAHGPIQRVEIGDDKIQGTDFVYTLQGWLKGINHPNLKVSDPGNDGSSITAHAKDVYGQVLSYFDEDFNRDGSAFNSDNDLLVSSLDDLPSGQQNDLYNGNISSWTLQSQKPSDQSQTSDIIGFKYRHDQLQRIKKSEHYKQSGTTLASSNDYYSDYTYDGNGNIKTLTRKGYGATLNMDAFTYHYGTGDLQNRLLYVDDNPGYSGNYGNDLDQQSAGNYDYNAIGQLTKDEKEGIAAGGIEWNINAKIKKATKTDGTVLTFVYDAMGNRVSKTSTLGSISTATFYVRDASGNIMSTYERTINGSQYVYKQIEAPIYGAKRIGMYDPMNEVKSTAIEGEAPCFCESTTLIQVPIQELYSGKGFGATYERKLGKKRYEFVDHLGNVRVVTSDVKLPVDENSDGTVDYFESEVVTMTDYYPFGMQMPGRAFNSDDYRFGFQGQETDQEMWSGSSFYKYRMNDSRIGRFFAVDPLAPEYPHNSPYAFSENSNIAFVELEGLEKVYFGRITLPYRSRRAASNNRPNVHSNVSIEESYRRESINYRNRSSRRQQEQQLRNNKPYRHGMEEGDAHSGGQIYTGLEGNTPAGPVFFDLISSAHDATDVLIESVKVITQKDIDENGIVTNTDKFYEFEFSDPRMAELYNKAIEEYKNNEFVKQSILEAMSCASCSEEERKEMVESIQNFYDPMKIMQNYIDSLISNDKESGNNNEELILIKREVTQRPSISKAN